METNSNHIHWKIAGAAGQGIKSTGLIFSKACTRGGLWTFAYTEYPSLVRGGHNTYQVRVEDTPIKTLVRPIDMLVALNDNAMNNHKNELAPGAAVIFDGERIKTDIANYGKDVRFYNIPATSICKEHKVASLMENQILLGASFALLSYDFSYVQQVLESEFAGKGDAIVQENIDVARTGYEYAMKNYDCEAFPHKLESIDNKEKKMILSGNDAVSLGALRAGCKFYAAYPMTPASSILHTLADLAPSYGMVVKHCEDEIGVANMTIGAGFAGVRAMCGTSSGGFALMQEAYSLAGITETPLVMVESMRGGPATGIPTWTEQADLKFVLSAGHGDFPRFVIAPGDPEECFYMTADAFNIADEYHTPVIILIDKHLSESFWTYPFFNNPVPVRRGPWVSNEELQRLANQGVRFKRYDLNTESGVSPRVVPGQHKNGIFLANSDEHDEYGYSNETIENRNAMFAKRARKTETYKKVMPMPKVYGPEDADVTIVSWGSTKTMAMQAIEWLNNDGLKVNMLQLAYVSPFPSDFVKNFLEKSKIVLNVEHNGSAQMADVIRQHTSYKIEHHLLKNDGRPIYPEEIADKVRQLIGVRS